MSGGCHQARHRARSGEVAGGEYRIRQKLAEHHPKERIPCGCQGFRGDGRQVREIFLPKSWGRRLGATVFDPVSSRKHELFRLKALVSLHHKLNPNRADVAAAALKASKSLIFTENVLYWAHCELNWVSRFDPLLGSAKTSNRGVPVPRTGCVTDNEKK